MKDLKFEFDFVLNSKFLKELFFLNFNKEGLKYIFIDYLKIRLGYMFLFEFWCNVFLNVCLVNIVLCYIRWFMKLVICMLGDVCVI